MGWRRRWRRDGCLREACRAVGLQVWSRSMCALGVIKSFSLTMKDTEYKLCTLNLDCLLFHLQVPIDVVKNLGPESGSSGALR